MLKKFSVSVEIFAAARQVHKTVGVFGEKHSSMLSCDISCNVDDHVLATLLSASAAAGVAGEETNDPPPFAISRTPGAGRGLVATRPIAQDSAIFTESPLIVGTSFKVQGITCVRCCAKLEPNNLSGLSMNCVDVKRQA